MFFRAKDGIALHRHTIYSKACMGMYVLMLEDFELILAILYAPEVCIRLIELAQLLVSRLAGKALLVQTRLISIEGGKEST